MHIDLTPGIQDKFLRPALVVILTLAAAASATAQDNDLSNYQGPGISSPGVGEVGSRGGKQLDLRIYGGVSGIYDSSLQPLTTDAKGNLIKIDNLYGVEASGGVFGVHSFRHAQLGLDYHGTYRRYNESTSYDGSDQTLALGYTYQGSRRVVLDLHESAGTVTLGNSGLAAIALSDPGSALNPGSLFFDSRSNFLQSTAALTWLKSAKTSFTMSGSGFLQDRKESTGLTNSWGYNLMGGVNRRVSKTTSLGLNYAHSHFEFPRYGSISDSNTYLGTLTTNFARYWIFSLEAGVAVTEIQSPFSFALSPALAALLGRRTVSGISDLQNLYPSGSATLKRQFQRASISFSYNRGVSSGNGFTMTSRTESALANFSYTGVRKVSLSADGGYNNMVNLGQFTDKIVQYMAGGSASYNLTHAMYLNLRYDFRHQLVDLSGYDHIGSRVALGILFSTGKIPLSLW